MTAVTYAAGASLAAITLIYVFGPTYLLDNETNSSKKKTVVGLSNPANDCFINSVLQALSGLGDLRAYLIRETHRRALDERWVYEQAVSSLATKGMPEWKINGLQAGVVTTGLKQMLDALNERPIYKKTISAAPFIRVLESAFRQRISRQQQDAQEFLQVVAERLSEEYHAGHRARMSARKTKSNEQALPSPSAKIPTNPESTIPATATPLSPSWEYKEEEDGFPMEGAYKSQIECMTCRFKPKPKESTFCTLTLNVPHGVSSSSLNTCFDGMFKKEIIDDWKCEKCRLLHAIREYEGLVKRARSIKERDDIEEITKSLRQAAETDPETPPHGIQLPQSKYAPSRKIERHTYMTRFPKILAVHLSRSIFGGNMSQKNSAKVSFPENFKAGTLRYGMQQYRLLAVVTHKGNHYSGHYESFRRQTMYPPFSNPGTFQPSGVYSKMGSPATTPVMKPVQKVDGGSPMASTPDLLVPSPNGSSNPDGTARKSADNSRESPSSSKMRVEQIKDAETSSIKSAKSGLSKLSLKGINKSGSSGGGLASTINGAKPEMPGRKKKKANDRWWRISDEKVKEAKTSDVLSMQREAYMLFYELDRGD